MRKGTFEVVSCEPIGGGTRAFLRQVDGDDKATDDIASLGGEVQLVVNNVNAEGVKEFQPGDRFNLQLTKAKTSAPETPAASPAIVDADTAPKTAVIK